MCRGVQNHEDFCRRSVDDDEHDEVASEARNRSCVGCELCGDRATLYCQADDAYLCQKCDRWVHGANFLALRHIRCVLCTTCQGSTQRFLVGASMEVLLPNLVGKIQNDDEEEEEQTSESAASIKLPFLFL
ncbi:B-box domain protein 30 [Linum perenne]